MAEFTIAGVTFIEKTVGGQTVLVAKSGQGAGTIPTLDDEAYNSAWDGSLDPVTKNSVYDFLETLQTQAAPVQSVAGRTGAVVLTKADTGLANVDNTSDANKPVSVAQQTALDAKATATKLQSSGVGFYDHNTTATASRPTGFVIIIWRGSVEPTNADANDIWIDTSA